MFELHDINSLLNNLLEVVDLGFMAMPTIIFLSVALVLFGVGFRKNWLSFTGIFVIFTYYLLLEVASYT
jgi:predicted membrane protein